MKITVFQLDYFSFHLKNHETQFMENFCKKLKVCKLAVSYGGIDAYIAPGLAFQKTNNDKSLTSTIIRIATGMQTAEKI